MWNLKKKSTIILSNTTWWRSGKISYTQHKFCSTRYTFRGGMWIQNTYEKNPKLHAYRSIQNRYLKMVAESVDWRGINHWNLVKTFIRPLAMIFRWKHKILFFVKIANILLQSRLKPNGERQTLKMGYYRLKRVPTSQPVIQPVYQSCNQLVSHPLYQICKEPVSQSASQQIYQSCNQPVSALLRGVWWPGCTGRRHGTHQLWRDKASRHWDKRDQWKTIIATHLTDGATKRMSFV
jgi:hypothetical protein